MMIDASSLPDSALNEAVRGCGGQCRIIGCLGQRFIGAGLERGSISISGIPGMPGGLSQRRRHCGGRAMPRTRWATP